MYGQGSSNPQSGSQGSQTPIAPPYLHRPPMLPHSFQQGPLPPPPPHTSQPILPGYQHVSLAQHLAVQQLAPGRMPNPGQPYLHSSATVHGSAPLPHAYAPTQQSSQHSSYLASVPPPPPFGSHRPEMLQASLPYRGLPPPPPPSQGQGFYRSPVHSLPKQLASVQGHNPPTLPPPPPPPPPLPPTSSFLTPALSGSSAESHVGNPQMLSTAPPPPPTSSAPPIPPPMSNSQMMSLPAPVIDGSIPQFYSDFASKSSKPSGDKLGPTSSINEVIPLNQGGHNVPVRDEHLYLEVGGGAGVCSKLDEGKTFSESSHLLDAVGSHMSSDSDMEMEDDITQSDNHQAVNHPIGGKTHCNHLIAGAFDVREQLHELQSSAQSDAATKVLSLSGSSRLNNGEQGPKPIHCYNQLALGESVSEVHSPVINSAGANEKCSLRITAADGCIDSDQYSDEVLKGSSPFKLVQDYVSEDCSENNEEPCLKDDIPKTASDLVTVGSEDLQQQQPPYGLDHSAIDKMYGLSGKVGSSSILPPDILDSNQRSRLTDFGAKNPSHLNPYPTSFEQLLNSGSSSDVSRQEKVASYSCKDDHSSCLNHASLDGQGVSVGTRQPIPSPNSARGVAQIIPSSGSDQYDPFFDSIEPASNSFKRLDHIQKWESIDTDVIPRLSASNKSLDVEENKKEVRGVAVSTSLENEEFGEIADAEVGDVENQSQSTPVVVNVNMGDVEIDQIKSPLKSKTSKESRSMKLFKATLADFVKEILKPSWRQGNMSKEAFKTIVKKTVDKVAGAMKNNQIPKSKAKIDHYIDSSQQKLTKLVMGYVDKYAKG
ncbi:hypothetical protein OIU85_017380 [Salix viminalis]|uniref:Uncharacterized protein n=1 Tax=Salix viminalis TaxID=40686 RepID=A0A9Q0V771_SALVM|nr:hypothetical protein OIU85_017380 [Salix viminalis]KAJ6743422.1 hypothetical protein OIU85_017380 [Salix viminalis]